jgi:hypothetical protein
MTKLLFLDFPHVVPQFYFADNSDNVRLFKEKAKLTLINNLNVKVITIKLSCAPVRYDTLTNELIGVLSTE